MVLNDDNLMMITGGFKDNWAAKCHQTGEKIL